MRNLSDGQVFAAALLLVFAMLMLGHVAVALLPTMVALLAALVLAARFGPVQPRRSTC